MNEPTIETYKEFLERQGIPHKQTTNGEVVVDVGKLKPKHLEKIRNLPLGSSGRSKNTK